MRLQVSKRAWKQIEKIHQWRVAHRPESRDRFLDELAKLEELLLASPEPGTEYAEHKTGKVRRVLLTSTQHYLYYRYRPDRDELVVLTVQGTPRRRQPKL